MLHTVHISIIYMVRQNANIASQANVYAHLASPDPSFFLIQLIDLSYLIIA